MSKENRKIKNAKILKDGTSVSYVEAIDKDDIVVEVHHDVNSQHQPTDDFRDSVERLKRHFAVILGDAKVNDLKEVTDETLLELRVTGIARKGEGEAEGVVITGMKRCLGKHWVSVNTPFLTFTDNEAYKFAGELYSHCNVVCNQALKWVDGERKPPAQQEIDFTEPEGEAPKVAPHKRKAEPVEA